MLCNICETKTPHKELFKKWGYPIFKCESCELVTCGSTETFDPNTYYDEGYYQGSHHDSYPDYAGSELVVKQEFNRMLKAVKEFVEPGKTLLEIGCAYGYFLDILAPLYDVYGVEISDHSIKKCRDKGHEVFKSISEASACANKKFDFTLLVDCIEHVENPRDLLMECNRILAPSGKLMLTTGDVDSLMSKMMGKNWRLMTPPQHLFYFSKITMTKLLESCGYKVTKVDYPSKKVPYNLIRYILKQRYKVPIPNLKFMNNRGIPLKTMDAMRVFAEKVKEV